MLLFETNPMKIRFFYFIITLVLCTVSGIVPVSGQNSTGGKAKSPEQSATASDVPGNTEDSSVLQKKFPDSEKEETEGENTIMTTLRDLIRAAENTEKKLKEKKKEQLSAKNPEEKKRMEGEIAELQRIRKELDKNLEQIVTSTESGTFDAEKEADSFNWKDEILNLVGPLLHEVKKMTERPRKIEKLRSETAYYEQQLRSVAKAVGNIEELLKQAEKEDKILKNRLEKWKKNWADKEIQIINQIKVNRYQLDEILNEKQSLWFSVQSLLRSFFKSRGKNMVLAVLSFAALFISLRLIHRFIHAASPLHRRGRHLFIIRLLDVLYHLFTIIGSVCALLAVLYVSGDWLLLSLAIIFMLGLAWTAKTGLPLFWKQIQLMLNLGMVRENELLVYQGIPWKVISLHIYALLENPALSTGIIRLPLSKIMELHSRPFQENEPWFPSRVKDWVLLSDGTLGRVISQSPEMVQIKLRRDGWKTYTTPDYLAMTPQNITKEFCLRVSFGIDYRHQAHITREIPEKLKISLEAGLKAEGYEGAVTELIVGAEEAGESSLNLLIIGHFHGKIAKYYYRVRRNIQTICIETCTANGWMIPFPQLTVHMENNGKQRRANPLR